MYIIIEGMPGTGKTSLAKCLADTLNAKYTKSLFSNTTYGNKFRVITQSGEYKDDVVLYLMDLMLDELRVNKLLSSGQKDIVRDKTYTSSIAHLRAHGFADKADLSDALEYAYKKLADYSIEPDYVVYIRTDLNIIKKHLSEKKDLSVWDEELTSDYNKHTAQRKELEKELMRKYKDKLIQIDCFSGTLQEMCLEIIKKIKETSDV